MKSKETARKPTFSNEAIWDMDSNMLDVDNYPEYTITSIFERGNSRDLSELIRYYGVDQVKETLSKSENLMPRAVHMANTLFNLQRPATRAERKKEPA